MKARFFAFALLLPLSLRAHPAGAEGALVIGLIEGDPRKGFAYGITSNTPIGDAGSRAVRECRGVEVKNTSNARAACKLIETFRDQCASVVINGDSKTPSTAVGWGIGPDRKTAAARARTQCETMRRGQGRECRAEDDTECDGSAK